MKKNDENQNNNDKRTSRHIFRKKQLDDTTISGNSNIPDLNNIGDFSEMDEEFDDITFSFSDEDIERYKQKNLAEAEKRDKQKKAKASDASFYKHHSDGSVESEPLPEASSPKKEKKSFWKKNKHNIYDAAEGETSYDINLKMETNKEIMRVTYLIVAVFIGMIVYFVHFDVVVAEDVINNIHNSRLDIMGENLLRGSIYSSDGAVLAKTVVDDEGNSVREYPEGCTYAHVIGTSDINKSGVELSCDYNLVTADVTPLQQILNDISGEKSVGNSVYTTLDSVVQQAAHDALGTEKGAVIALDPNSGKILAMVSKPDYDPNTLKEEYTSIVAEEGSKTLLNQATQGTFAPGSIFKIVTSLCYIRNATDTNSYEYYCDGYINLSTDTDYSYIRCYDGEVHGYVDLEESFAHSCNASFANIGINLPENALKTTAEDLLFNKKLPTSFTTSKSTFSLSSNASEWLTGATSIGQGHTSITPIHALMIVSAIANDGKLMEPYVVDSIRSAEGSVLESYSAESAGQLMTKKEADTLTGMMVSVVNNGTGYNLSYKDYQVAGKTGTAEVEGSGNNAWFVGFAPADNPQIAIVVLVEDSGTASSNAVPIAGEVFDAYFNRYN